MTNKLKCIKIHKKQTLSAKNLLFFFCVFHIAACDNKHKAIIKCRFENSNNDTLYIKELTEAPYGYKDSTVIGNNSEATFSFMPSVPAFYSVYKKKNKSSISLFLYPGNVVNVKAKFPDFSDLQIEGSNESAELNILIRKRNDCVGKVYALIDSINAIRDSLNDQRKIIRFDSMIYEHIQEHKKYSVDFLKKNSGSPITVIALQQYVGDQPLFNFQKDFEYFNEVDSILMIKYPAVEAVKFLHSQVSMFRDVQKIPDVGKKAPDISLPDTSGKIITLSSFKGKYVLLDFWASFCQSCRKMHPYLKKAWWNYHWRGFEIYQVSLDRSKDAWKAAIRNDGLMWTNVSDLKMWNSIVVSQYRFTEMPANYLINPDGVIIAHNIPGEKLEEVLNNIFNNKKK